MRRHTLKRCVLFLTGLCAVALLVQAQQLTVAVSTFDTIGGVSQDVADSVRELLIGALDDDGTVNVADRNSFDKILTEMKFQASDWADGNRVAQLGKATSANSIIRGTVMSLAGQTVITARILDIKTAEILSSENLELKNINEIFKAMPDFVKKIVTKLPNPPGVYKIGGKGPGGGIIFFAEGGTCMECSQDLGSVSWYDALNIAKNYRGGGFTGWHLPDIRELDLMYQNLKTKGLGGFTNSWYWSSTQTNSSNAWAQHFGNGSQYNGYPNLAGSVRAVLTSYFSP